MERRLAWAKEARTWGAEDWTRIIWTDECSIELGKNLCVCHVWRYPGEEYLAECLVPTFKSGRMSVMVWACIAYDWKGPLIFLPKDRRKGSDYVDLVLAGPLWDFYTKVYNDHGGARVMEDRAPIHTSMVVKRFRDANSLETIPHPAQSPDVNPIEHVWKLLKTRVNNCLHRPRNVDDLREALLEEWEKIDQESINQLIESMPDHVEAVLQARGGSTRY
jgi:hypothetical protein